MENIEPGDYNDGQKLIETTAKNEKQQSEGSRGYYHEDGYLVPSPWCGFCFETVFQALKPKINHFCILMLLSLKICRLSH